MPSWPASTKPFSFAWTAASFFVLLFGHGERLSASAEAFAGSALSAETTSTQSSADRW